MNTPLHLLENQAVLGANTTAILIAVGLVALIVILLFTGKKKKADEAIAAPEEPKKIEGEPARPKAMPASKEVFAPLPPAEPKKEAPSAAREAAKEPAASDDKAAEEEPWELREAAEPAKEKAAEPPSKVKAEPDKPKSKPPETSVAKPAAAQVAPAPDEDDAARAARLEEEKARKKAEDEKRAEAARQAEARDKALKAEAERVKAENKAKAEAEAREKAEAKKREAAARAEAEKKKQAELDKKKAEEEAKAGAKAPAKEKKVEAAPAAKVHKLEVEEVGKSLRDGLGKTRKEGFIAKLGSLFSGKQIDQDLMDEVEEALFTADIGVRTADRLLQAVKDALSKKELKDADKVWEVLRGEAQKILEGAVGKPVTQPRPGEPMVTMVLGVNGTGKTTSIGKLAHKLIAEQRKVTLVAGDTFRAAAAEQLEHWARRVGAPCIKGKEGADPASVVFDGVKQALEEKAEFVLVDTAGRLHNNVNLMEELKKVRRVMGRAIEGAPHEVLMVLDATTGQNGITQAKQFKDATDVTGIILTKLDGTAKGGVVLGVCDELKIPIRWIGIGERVSDLRPFDPKEFVDELFAPPT